MFGLLVGLHEGHPVCKKKLIWFVGGDDLTGRLIAPVVTTTSITLSSNKIQNGDSLALANPGPPGEMVIKMDTEGKKEREMAISNMKTLTKPISASLIKTTVDSSQLQKQTNLALRSR